MGKRVFVFLILAYAMALVGCTAAINKKMQSWEGKHYGDLIAAWGAPEQVLDDGQGGKIFDICCAKDFH